VEGIYIRRILGRRPVRSGRAGDPELFVDDHTYVQPRGAGTVVDKVRLAF
jgi:hypothetical protein